MGKGSHGMHESSDRAARVYERPKRGRLRLCFGGRILETGSKWLARSRCEWVERAWGNGGGQMAGYVLYVPLARTWDG